MFETLESKLSEMYVFPDVAAKVVPALKDHGSKKDYDQITSAQEFARRVRRICRQSSRQTLANELRSDRSDGPCVAQ